MKYIVPEYELEAFNCPHPDCHVYAKQEWKTVALWGVYDGNEYPTQINKSHYCFAQCSHCKGHTVWVNEILIYPLISIAPPPHEEMPSEIKDDYDEAASIISQSPRGAAALLRLAIQKLCKELGESGNDINRDIGELVKKGLPIGIQKALDIVRVIGNESVHPGELNLKDDHETAVFLFSLVNEIVEDRIARPKRTDDFYASLPESKRRGIAIRDRNNAN